MRILFLSLNISYQSQIAGNLKKQCWFLCFIFSTFHFVWLKEWGRGDSENSWILVLNSGMCICLENRTERYSLKNPQILKIIAYAICQKCALGRFLRALHTQSFFKALDSIDDSMADIAALDEGTAFWHYSFRWKAQLSVLSVVRTAFLQSQCGLCLIPTLLFAVSYNGRIWEKNCVQYSYKFNYRYRESLFEIYKRKCVMYVVNNNWWI